MSLFRKKSNLSLFSRQKHRKLGDKWAENKEPVKDGITFHLKYVGSVLLEDPNSRIATANAIKTVVSMAKASGKKSNKVAVNVSPHGIKIIDLSSGDLYLDVSIYRISYCSADATHDHVVAFISTNSNETLECHAFLCPKRKVAQAVAITIAQSFNLAFETWQITRERTHIENSSTTLQNNAVGISVSSNGVHDGSGRETSMCEEKNVQNEDQQKSLIDLNQEQESATEVAKRWGLDKDEELDRSFTRLMGTSPDPFISTNLKSEEEKEIIDYLNSHQSANGDVVFNDSSDFLLSS